MVITVGCTKSRIFKVRNYWLFFEEVERRALNRQHIACRDKRIVRGSIAIRIELQDIVSAVAAVFAVQIEIGVVGWAPQSIPIA